MVSRCTICAHPRRRSIEKAAKGLELLDLVEVCSEYSVSRVVLERHMAGCPARAKKAARDKQEAELESPPPAALPRAIGSHTEELHRSLANLARASEAEDINPAQRAALEGRKLSLLRELRRLEEGRGIHEHSDFAALVEDLVAAVVDELGPDAPEGLEGRIADRFEELQAARVVAGEKRRAA